MTDQTAKCTEFKLLVELLEEYQRGHSKQGAEDVSTPLCREQKPRPHSDQLGAYSALHSNKWRGSHDTTTLCNRDLLDKLVRY